MKNSQFRDEPSMEEALASIRQIINNDIQDLPKESRLKQARTPEAQPEKKSDASWPTRNEVLELTELVLPDGSIESLKRTEQASNAPSSSAPATSKNNPGDDAAESWLSPETIAASAAAMASLSSLAEGRISSEPLSGSTTLEQLMQDLLRPMLREWLDSHLPGIIKSVVREQIEKVIQRQRSS